MPDLSESLAPVLSQVGLIDADFVSTVNAYEAWQRRIGVAVAASVTAEWVSGSPNEKLCSLLPVQGGRPIATLFLPTRCRWVAVFQGSALGTDPSPIAVMARLLQCRTMLAAAAPSPFALAGLPAGDRRVEGVTVEVFEKDGHPKQLNSIRAISATKEGRWSFYSYGDTFDFEPRDFLEGTSIRSKFDLTKLRFFLTKMGVPADDPKLLDVDQPGYLVSVRVPPPPPARPVAKPGR